MQYAHEYCDEEPRVTDEAFSWAGQRWRVFFDAVRDFSEATGEANRLYPTIARSLAHAVHASCSLRILSEDGQFLNPGATFDPNPEIEALLRRTLGAAPVRLSDAPQLRWALNAPSAVLMEPVDWREFGVAARGQHQDRLHLVAPAVGLLAPMRGPSGPLGLVCFLRQQKESGVTFPSEDQGFAQDLVDHATVAVVNARGLSGRKTPVRGPLGAPTPAVEHALQDIRRKDALAHLAQGLAQDFDHLLSAIQLATHLQLEQLPKDDPQRLELDQLAAATAQASDIKTQLVSLSRQRLFRPEIIDLDRFLTAEQGEFQSLLGSEVQLNLQVEAGLPPVCVDRAQLGDTLTGLMLSAKERLPEGGSLLLSLSEADASETLMQIGLESGQYVVLSIRDFSRSARGEPLKGPRVSLDLQSLGLAVASAFAEHNGGTLSWFSEPEAGSTISLWLPILHDKGHAKVAEAMGGTTVMLAVEAPTPRLLIRRALRQNGYHVLDTGPGPRALEAARFFRQPVSLVILDGAQQQAGLERELLRSRPDLKLLFYVGKSGSKPTGACLLEPLTERSVIASVRQVLGAW